MAAAGRIAAARAPALASGIDRALAVASGGRARALALLSTVTVASTLLAASPARAEPYLAVRTGYKCGACHTNRTGGGKRTGFGVIYSQTTLPMVIRESAGAFDPALTDHASIGGDLRLVNRSVLRAGEDDNGFEFSEANLYAQVDLVPDFLTFYVDETFAPGGALNREAFIMLHGRRLNAFLKAGKMLLPYGLALWDDLSFIRRNTGFNYANQDLGVEVGLEPGPLSVAIAVTNGTQGGAENNRTKQVSALASTVHRHFRLGGSFSHNEGPRARRTVSGVFAGFNTGRFTLLGEYDVIDDEDDGGGGRENGEALELGNQRLAYAEGNLLLTRGLNLKFAVDYLDPFTEIDEDEQVMYRIGIEPFVTRFLQVRVFYRFRDAPPQLEQRREDELSLEIHAFF